LTFIVRAEVNLIFLQKVILITNHFESGDFELKSLFGCVILNNMNDLK